MYRILVVDDDPPIREWMKLCIERNFAGRMEADCAASGEEALVLFRERPYDIVITDIIMASMDGLTLLSKLYEMKADCCSIVLSSHSNFEYVRTAMKLHSSEYVLKQEMDETHLVEVLNRCVAVLLGRNDRVENTLSRDNFLSFLTSSASAGTVVSRKDLDDLGIALDDQDIMSYVIYRRCHHPTHFTMPSMAWETYSLSNTHSYAKADNYSILFCNVSAGQKTVEGILNEILLVNPDCAVLEGSLVHGVKELRNCLYSAKEIAPLGFYRPERLIPASMLETVRRARERSGMHLWTYWQNQQRRKNINTILEAMPKFYELSALCCPKNISEYKQLCAEIMQDISVYLEMEEADVEQRIHEITDAFTMDEIRDIIALAVAAGQNRNDTDKYSGYTMQALEYIRKHYATVAGLNEVAAHVHISPEYLARLFKSETGTTVIAYLNSCRLEKAKELLDQTPLKVFEIAETVGYSSVSYFSRLFKDTYGVNPFSYRNQTGVGVQNPMGYQ